MPSAGRDSREAGENAGENRGRRKAAAEGNVQDLHVGLRFHQALRLLHPIAVDEMVEITAKLVVDELREAVSVQRQDATEIQEFKVHILVGLPMRHPAHKRISINGGHLLGEAGLTQVHGRLVLMLRLVQDHPRIAAEKDLIGAVPQQENHQPLLGESTGMVMRQAYEHIDDAHQDHHVQVAYDPLHIDIFERGEIVFAPHAVNTDMMEQEREEDEGIQGDDGLQVEGYDIVERRHGNQWQELYQRPPGGQPAGPEDFCRIEQKRPAQQVAQQEFERGQLVGAHIHRVRRNSQPENSIDPVQDAPGQERIAPHLAEAIPLEMPENNPRTDQGDRGRAYDQDGSKDLVEIVFGNVTGQPQAQTYHRRKNEAEEQGGPIS